MKKIMAGLCLLVFTACFNESADSETTSTTPTLDSNTVTPVADSNTAILYLDNPHSDTFSIAMDSAGPTVTPADTILKKR